MKYKEEYEKHKNELQPIPETSEMVLSKELRPIQSKKIYAEKAKELQPNVNYGPGHSQLRYKN